MKLQALEYFIALAESRSINEAARRLYVAQPSLTKALQHLEKELGVQLFHREKTGITLTQAGEKILPEARQVVQYYKGWLALGKEAQSGTITVYSHISLSNFLLPDVLLDFKKRHPEVIVNHHAVLKPEEHLKDLSSPLLVLFICGQEEAREWAERYDCEYFTLFQGEYGCLVNRNSPLAQKASIGLEELADFYFICPKLGPEEAKSNASSPVLEQLLRETSPRRVIQVESVDAVIHTIRHHPDSYALSYYPALNRYEGVSSGQLVYVPIQGANTQGDLCLFCPRRARWSPLLQELIEDLDNAAEAFLQKTRMVVF